MERPMSRWTRLVRTMWRANAPLTATGLLMLVVLAAALVGLLADPRTITGAPAWLKPAKFAPSIAIFNRMPCLALTFLFGPAGWLLYIMLRSADRRA